MKMIQITLILLFLPYVSANIVMNSSVKLEPNIFMKTEASSLSYCPGEIMNITTQVSNYGNILAIFNLNKTVYNQYGTLFENKTWFSQQVNPLETKYYYLTKNVSESDNPGMYNVYTYLYYDGKIIENQSSFRIKQSYGTLVSSPSFIEETLFPGDFISKDLYLWLLFPCYGVNTELNTTGQISNWVHFSKNPVYLSPNTWNVTRVLLIVDLPWNTIPGDYTGNIIANINNQAALYIPITIHVQTTAIFDVQTEILSQYKEVCKGSEVKAKINVIKVFPPGPLDVNITYLIKSVGQIYDERKEVIAVTDSLEKFVTLQVPSNAQEGLYTYYTILDVASENWKINISSYDTFNVVTCTQPLQPPSVSGGGKTMPSSEIEVKKIEIKLNKYKITGIIGNLSSFQVKLKNSGQKNLTNIKLEISGIPPEWLTISPYKIDLIKPGEEKEFLVFIKTPLNAKSAVYQLLIKAKDSVESNQEKALYILSEDEKNLTLMLFNQAAVARSNATRVKYLTCLELKEVLTMLDEAENIFDLAKKYMDKGEYKKSQELFLKSMTDYESVNQKADFLIENRVEKIKLFGLPPFAKTLKEAKIMLDKNVAEKNYENFCENLNKTTKNIIYSIAEICILVILVAVAIYYAYYKYKKYKERKLDEKLKEIQKRLDYK